MLDNVLKRLWLYDTPGMWQVEGSGSLTTMQGLCIPCQSSVGSVVVWVFFLNPSTICLDADGDKDCTLTWLPLSTSSVLCFSLKPVAMLFINAQLPVVVLVLNRLNVKYIQPCGKPTVLFMQAVALSLPGARRR